METRVVGGGLAGSEAAHQIATRGGSVVLCEMRPEATTPAHKTADLAELVCSNSLKSKELTNAHGLLKEELRILGSVVLRAADETAIQGGKALVVDRVRFARRVTEAIEAAGRIRVVREESTEIPPGICVIATGPLTSDALSEKIRVLTGNDNLHFFDAISPIIDGASVDMEHAFFASRYAEASDDYLNCPLTKEEYEAFYAALMAGRRVDLRQFEDARYFEGCLPVEVMAERGKETLAFGPMKPVGIEDPKTGRRPYAVLQLRREDAEGRMYNLVGFQTKLTYPEQERVFRLIPGLKNVVFLRYGSIHRNTFIRSPWLITKALRLKTDERIHFAGQITGVEGYMESTAMGLMAGLSALCYARGLRFEPPPPSTCVGALVEYITTERKDFQPMNVNFGIVAGYEKRQKEAVVRRALDGIAAWKREMDERLGAPPL